MTARISYRLLAAGICLLLAGGLSATDDTFITPPSSPPASQPAFGDRPPSPHFFPGRILRSKAADGLQPPIAEAANRPQTPRDISIAPPHDDSEASAPLLEERRTLETRASPHFFLGHARLQMPIRRAHGSYIGGADIPVCQDPHLQLQPIASTAVAATEQPKPTAGAAVDLPKPTIALVAEPIDSPATLPHTSSPPSLPPAPLQSANLQPAAKPNLGLPHKILASLPQRQPSEKTATFAALKPAAVQPVTAQQTAVVQDRLARLGGSATPLQPAEVFSVPRPDFFAEEIEANGLQVRLPQPGSQPRS
ncbi:MAG: hypothetical protein JF612_09630, partial [Planctomycetia bacterium]|nr:hypothetical protein [Planctomycetia bacterium]